MQYSASRDIQIASEPIKTAFIHIFEEQEIRLIQKENIKTENPEEFFTLIRNINACRGRKELKNLIEENRSLIAKYSPLMHERTANLNNMDFEETKGKMQVNPYSGKLKNIKTVF